MNQLLIKDRSLLEGTDYFELLPGQYKGSCWGPESVFMKEQVFAYLEPLLVKHIDGYDHYSFMEVSKEQWFDILRELKDLKVNLSSKGDPVKYIFTMRAEFDSLQDMGIEDLNSLIGELVQWCEETLKTHPSISILGL